MVVPLHPSVDTSRAIMGHVSLMLACRYFPFFTVTSAALNLVWPLVYEFNAVRWVTLSKAKWQLLNGDISQIGLDSIGTWTLLKH